MWLAFFGLQYLTFVIFLYVFRRKYHFEMLWDSVIWLIKTRQFMMAGLFVFVLAPYFFANRVLMTLEDWLIPELRRIETEYTTKPNKIILIVGFPRSGTTNVHKSLNSRPHALNGTVFDLIFPSLILKFLFWPIASSVNSIAFKLIHPV